MSDRYRMMADQLNRMKPGEALRISRHDLNDLPGLPDWAAFSNITIGFDRVKESVFGSSLPDVWQFYNEPNGDITAYRMPERENRPKKIVSRFDRLLAIDDEPLP